MAVGGWNRTLHPAGQARQSAGGDLTSFAGSAPVPRAFPIHQRVLQNPVTVRPRRCGKQGEAQSEQFRSTSAHTDSSLAAATSDGTSCALLCSGPCRLRMSAHAHPSTTLNGSNRLETPAVSHRRSANGSIQKPGAFLLLYRVDCIDPLLPNLRHLS